MADRQKKQRAESSAGAGSSKGGLKVKDAEVGMRTRITRITAGKLNSSASSARTSPHVHRLFWPR